MPPENTSFDTSVAETNTFNKVTPFSKYLAMALFVLLPFIGGYVGYKYAPEKVVEVEKIVEVPVSPDSSVANSGKYAWVSYENVLRWEQIESSRGYNGYGFKMEIPITRTLSKNQPTIMTGSEEDSLRFVYEDDGGSVGVGMVYVSLKKDDDTDYSADSYSEGTNANGLTYYEFDSGYSGETNILLSFPNIDNKNMTLSILISDIAVHLADADIQRIINSVAKTTQFDSGD